VDELKAELKRLNELLQRFVEFYLGNIPCEVFSQADAFRAVSVNGRLLLRPIKNVDPVSLEQLWEIDHIIEPAKENLENFLKGLPAQNVLIYGPRGTGKSSLVKALFNKYRSQGLKIIEITLQGLLHLDELIEAVQCRQERFILFCDDLSFQSPDSTFFALKTLLEGTLEVKPNNLIIYATSNRRNMIAEFRTDNLPQQSNEELHPSDSLQEKISLSERFGLRLYTGFFNQDSYLRIVRNYLRLKGIDYNETISREAINWATSHGGFSGRVAKQFVEFIEAERLRQKEF